VRVLFDTNVILDLLLDREPFVEAAADLLSRAERREVQGYLGATTVTTLFYLLRKALGPVAARDSVRSLLEILDVAPVHRGTLEGAMDRDLGDFEDAVLLQAGVDAGMDLVVTRDPAGFQKSEILVHSPREAVALLEALESR
jgi:predicted nucleic acid-binding protein